MVRTRTIAVALTLTGLVPTLGTCGGSEPLVSPAAETKPERKEPRLEGWHYVVEIAPSLERADVRICFDGPPPAWLIPGRRIAAPHAHDVRAADGPALPRKGRAYDLAGVGEDGCVEYWVDFIGLEEDPETGRAVGRTGDSLMARPSTWLWRPDMLPSDADVTLRFSLPEGMNVSVPWPSKEGVRRGDAETVYMLEPTAFHWLSYTVFGNVAVDRFDRAGAAVELVTLDAELACPEAGLRAWVTDAVDTVALLFDGRFPRDRLQLVVIPVERGGGTVHFGMAGRGGGPGVCVFMDDAAAAEELPGGWTTIHELLHHGMPFIDEPWMAEGWVSYYTELMRTRAGNRSELEGWQALADGFARGRRRGGDIPLAETSETMHETHLYQRVYWGGAAVALLADVQMRLETDGARGLDDAMKELRRCCGDADHTWAARDLLEKLDAWYGRPLFTETADVVLAQEGFPDLNAALGQLGVLVEGGTVRLDEGSELAPIRRAIMAPRRANDGR